MTDAEFLEETAALYADGRMSPARIRRMLAIAQRLEEAPREKSETEAHLRAEINRWQNRTFAAIERYDRLSDEIKELTELIKKEIDHG